MVSDPLDELTVAPDVISGGGEDFSAFVDVAVARAGQAGVRPDRRPVGRRGYRPGHSGPRLRGLAAGHAGPMTRTLTCAGILVNTSNRRFRRHRVTEQPGDPPETAVEGPADLVGERATLLAALRQLPPRQRVVGRAALLGGPDRRAGRAAGSSGRRHHPARPGSPAAAHRDAAGRLGLVAIIAAATLLTLAAGAGPAAAAASGHGSRERHRRPRTAVFASGTADGHALAARRAGHRRSRLPAASPRSPSTGLTRPGCSPIPGTAPTSPSAAAAPGIGFAFVQVPNGIDGSSSTARKASRRSR